MRLRNILKRKPRLVSRPLVTDWSTAWTTRDWADLPTHHPRDEDKVVR